MGRVEIDESGERAPGAAPVRAVRLPPPAPPRLEPLSRVQAGFFRSVDFYARIGILGAIAVAVVGVLAVRLASLQVLRKPLPLPVLLHQSIETVPLPGARGGARVQGALGAGPRSRGPDAARPLRPGLRAADRPCLPGLADAEQSPGFTVRQPDQVDGDQRVAEVGGQRRDVRIHLP